MLGIGGKWNTIVALKLCFLLNLRRYQCFLLKLCQLINQTGVPQVSANVLKKLAGKNLFGDDKDAVWVRDISRVGEAEVVCHI